MAELVEGEIRQWRIARQSSLENCVFKDEVAGETIQRIVARIII
jgi:hypothetical protein